MSAPDLVPDPGPLRRAVAIVGPTAAGKSDLGLSVAARLGCAVLCCDSVQIYRGLDIGSAKPSLEDQRHRPHFCLDLCDPDAEFSAGDYAREAHRVLADQPAVFVGGTGFYLRATMWTSSGEDDSRADDPRRRAFEREWTEREGDQPGGAHRALAATDPELAAQIHPRNFVRTLRSLWLCELHGEPVTQVRKRDPPRRRLDLLAVVLDPGQGALDAAITRRCDGMLAAGFLDEVEKLRRAGYDSRFRSMRSLGYKQILDHLQGRETLADARAQIVHETREFARRQRTWFRHQLVDESTGSGSPIWIRDPGEFPWPAVEAFVEGRDA